MGGGLALRTCERVVGGGRRKRLAAAALPATPGRRHSIRRLTYRVVYSVRGAGAKGFCRRSIGHSLEPLKAHLPVHQWPAFACTTPRPLAQAAQFGGRPTPVAPDSITGMARCAALPSATQRVTSWPGAADLQRASPERWRRHPAARKSHRNASGTPGRAGWAPSRSPSASRPALALARGKGAASQALPGWKNNSVEAKSRPGDTTASKAEEAGWRQTRPTGVCCILSRQRRHRRRVQHCTAQQSYFVMPPYITKYRVASAMISQRRRIVPHKSCHSAPTGRVRVSMLSLSALSSMERAAWLGHGCKVTTAQWARQPGRIRLETGHCSRDPKRTTECTVHAKPPVPQRAGQCSAVQYCQQYGLCFATIDACHCHDTRGKWQGSVPHTAIRGRSWALDRRSGQPALQMALWRAAA
ncbi:hypothetical protein ACCO45_010649 [Purpureocillium lilacinum]|uniref:Uncharacterized protein n=1 Tax=Purpureocillium lilacinum TaxID=33203 RepID=A0ACC4DFS0_PURLI